MSSQKIIMSQRNDAIGISNSYIVDFIKSNSNYDNVEIIYFKKRFGIISELFNLFKLFFILNKKDDVLFTDPKEIVSNILFLKKMNASIICYHLDKDPLYYKFFFSLISINKLLDKCNRIYAISDFTKHQLLEKGFSPNHINVVYLGIDRNKFYVDKKKFDFKYILVVGSENHRKNMPNILKTYKKISEEYPHLKLVKVGRVKDEDRYKTLELINEYTLDSKSILFYDDVSVDDLRRLYSSAEFLLFPSLLEGFGYPIVEAMACGCPVITSNISPMSDLQNNNNLLVDPTDVNSISKVCFRLLKEKDLKNEAVKKGIVRSNKFNWENTIKSLLR